MMEQYREASVAPRNLAPVGQLHWRLQFTATNDAQVSYVSIAEINFRETVGTDSLMDGTISASSTYGAGYEPPKAVDNNSATAWICAQFQYLNSWWRMSTAAPRLVKQIKLQAGNSAGFAGQMPSAFKVQTSDDGTTWTDRHTVTGQTGWTANEVRTFTLP